MDSTSMSAGGQGKQDGGPGPGLMVAAIGLCLVGGVIWASGGAASNVGIFLIGVVTLLAGGKWLVDSAVVIARRLGLSTLTIGLTIVACGTSLPELVFTLIATIRGNGELAFGNVVGSNIANIGLVLGAAAMIRAIDVHSRVVKVESPILILVSALMVATAWLPLGDPPGYDRTHGIGLLAIFAFVLFLWYRSGRVEASDPMLREMQREVEDASVNRPLWLMAIVLLAGMLMLAGGAQLAERGAVGIATWAGLSQALIGLTIVAIATSLPEVATTVVACIRGHTDLAVGNVVGSNLFNILLVLGVTATIKPIVPVPGGSGLEWMAGLQDLGCMMLMTAFLAVIIVTQRRVSRIEGTVLLLLYGSYIVWSVARELLSP